MTSARSIETTGQVTLIESVVIRFAGDSGDGVQLTGGQFTQTSAMVGNDISTLPNYPAEIRAPVGTLFGVSGFQIQIGATSIRTPGDAPDVLVAFNPAALKTNIADLRKGGLLLVNEDAFTDRNLEKAGYEHNPLDDDSLAGYQVAKVQMTRMTRDALKDVDLRSKDKDRSKNFFALGMMYQVYSRPLEHTINFLNKKFARKGNIAEANIAVLKAGYYYAETAELFHSSYKVPPAKIDPGTYRNVTGNMATALGMVAAATRAGLNLFLGSYPITPATEILHHLAGMRAYGVRTLQAEDEIAAVCAAIGASYAGQLGACTTSGPGLMLKGEAIALALMTELPLLIVDVQRGGPSTGLPTKAEQGDLNLAIFGRGGDSPLPVIAASSPADCFDAAFEAGRVTMKYRTPVILLTDSYLANGSEPWRIPATEDLPAIDPGFASDPEGFQPYSRDPETLARPWIRPGTPGLEHRIGGIEKEDGSGNICYDPANHLKMGKLRAEKVQRIRQEMGDLPLIGDLSGDLLVIGWGSTKGAISTAVERALAEGKAVSATHLRWVWPLHEDLGSLIAGFKHVLVPELNFGQLQGVLNSAYLADIQGLHVPTGLPLSVNDVNAAIDTILSSEV